MPHPVSNYQFLTLKIFLTIFSADDICDDLSNTPECNYDGGDCCGDEVNTDFCIDCQCLDPKQPAKFQLEPFDNITNIRNKFEEFYEVKSLFLKKQSAESAESDESAINFEQ